MACEVGSVYRVTFTVKDDTGALEDPAVKTVTVTLPDQTTATLSIQADDVGTFHADYTIAQEGLHRVSVSTTSPTTARTDYFNANNWRSIIGIDEAKLFINDSDADKDPILRQIMAAATGKAEDIVGVCVPQRFVDERVVGSDRPAIRVPHPPLLNETAVETVTSVWSGGPVWTTDALIHYPDSGVIEPINMIGFWLGPWKVTYTAGRMVIPESIQLAVKEIVYDMWSTQRPYGANDMEPGPEDTAKFEAMMQSYKIPPHAEMLLEADEQPGFA